MEKQSRCSRCGRPATGLNRRGMCNNCITSDLLGAKRTRWPEPPGGPDFYATQGQGRSYFDLGREHGQRDAREFFAMNQEHFFNPFDWSEHTCQPRPESSEDHSARKATEIWMNRAIQAETEVRTLKYEMDRMKQDFQMQLRLMSQIINSRNAPSAGVIPQEMVKKLLRLAHPDLHGNSQLATEVTQWLLKMRSK